MTKVRGRSGCRMRCCFCTPAIFTCCSKDEATTDLHGSSRIGLRQKNKGRTNHGAHGEGLVIRQRQPRITQMNADFSLPNSDPLVSATSSVRLDFAEILSVSSVEIRG